MEGEMKTLERKASRKRLSLDTLAVETFAAQSERVVLEAVAFTETNCHFTGRDSTCPCCSDPFTCPCSFPCEV
jgi:hypothetical protein